jgi:hypothetical protein
MKSKRERRLTTQAQRPGPREAWIATVMRWPGSLQRMVRRQGHRGGYVAVRLFPSPPAKLVDLGPAHVEYHNALIAAADGGKMLTAIKNEKRTVLVDMLRKNATYVQGIASQNLSGLLSSGYGANSTNRTPTPLATPVISKLDNSMSAQLILSIGSVANTRSHQVEIKNGVGGWTLVGVYAYGRGIVLPGLTTAQSYSVRVRGIGGSLGYSEWSDAVSRVVT